MKFCKDLIRPALPVATTRDTQFHYNEWGFCIELSPRVLRAVYNRSQGGECSTVGLFDISNEFPVGLMEALSSNATSNKEDYEIKNRN